MSQVADLATLKELTSNTSDSLSVYLHTNKTQMRAAMRKLERGDLNSELEQLFDKITRSEIDRKKFVEAVNNLLR